MESLSGIKWLSTGRWEGFRFKRHNEHRRIREPSHLFFFFSYLPEDLIRSPTRKNEKIDFHGRGYLEWQTSPSITPAFSHPSLCALAKRHLRPKQCDLWEAFPPLHPSNPPSPPICRALPVCVKDLLSPYLLFFTPISRSAASTLARARLAESPVSMTWNL